MVHRSDLQAHNDRAFARELTALISSMRAFARTLTSDPAQADDLAQDALAKAWGQRASFALGTNLKAWVFTILRNQFYSDRRRAWRSSQLDPEMAERALVANDNPAAIVELAQLRQALGQLNIQQREALVLVGAGGLSYEEAAQVCGCALGTVKSRVSRARKTLLAILDSGAFPHNGPPAGDAGALLIDEVEHLQRSRCHLPG